VIGIPVLQNAKARPVLAIIFAGSAAAQGANPFAFLFGGVNSLIYRLPLGCLDPVGDFCMARLKLSGGSAIHGVNWAALHRRPRLIQLESEVAPI
jgi:hypothetical protein